MIHLSLLRNLVNTHLRRIKLLSNPFITYLSLFLKFKVTHLRPTLLNMSQNMGFKPTLIPPPVAMRWFTMHDDDKSYKLPTQSIGTWYLSIIM